MHGHLIWRAYLAIFGFGQGEHFSDMGFFG